MTKKDAMARRAPAQIAPRIPPGLPVTPYVIAHVYYDQSKASQDPQERPSHYQPTPDDRGLRFAAIWGLGSLTALLCSLLVGQAIISFGNANYWANERQYRQIYNHPGATYE